jgi:hypothetical protein
VGGVCERKIIVRRGKKEAFDPDKRKRRPPYHKLAAERANKLGLQPPPPKYSDFDGVWRRHPRHWASK